MAGVIGGKVELPPVEERKREIKKWLETNKDLDDCYKQIRAQTEYVQRLAKEAKYDVDLNVEDLFVEWEHDKHVDILTYRDKSFTSKFSGNKAPLCGSPWIDNYDDDVEKFISNIKIE